MQDKKWNATVKKILFELVNLFDESKREEVKEKLRNRPKEKKSYFANWKLLFLLECILAAFIAFPITHYIYNEWFFDTVFSRQEAWRMLLGTAVCTYVIVLVMVMIFEKISLTATVIFLITVGYNQYKGNRLDFNRLFERYNEWMVYTIERDGQSLKNNIEYANDIVYKVRRIVTDNYNHRFIKRFVKENSFNLEEEGANHSHFWRNGIELFTQIERRWKYLPDPYKTDLFRKPQETILTFMGDCDDFAILTSAVMSHYGMKMRIIITQNHMYTEVGIPNIEIFNRIVKPQIEISNEYRLSKKRPLCYHTDNNGVIWLNLDYTAPYPGGRFMNERVYAIINF